MKATTKTIGEVHTFLGSFTNRRDSQNHPPKVGDPSKLFLFLKTIAVIAAGSLIYAVALHFFVFSHGILLGGTGGVSVLLNHFLPRLSSESYLVIINTVLMLVAVVVLGKAMAGKTMLGSLFTTLFVGALDSDALAQAPLIENVFLSAIIGAGTVAIGSTMLFCANSSSGGTDIIALIIKKYSRISIGRALLFADILIVLLGILSSAWTVAVASVVGLLIKTLGIDLLIHWQQRPLQPKERKTPKTE